MCGLFGFSKYGTNHISNLSTLTNALANEASVRGTDATGIDTCNKGVINIIKEAKPAYKMDFKHSDNISALIGHTRHSTQGSEKRNYNNHPFIGKTDSSTFALAHNGVLLNDMELRKKLCLPKTKIETDSYIAVQLIESKKDLNFDTLKYMAETIEGSFSFSVLDDKNDIYLVKGDSPLTILHFPDDKIYVYASTENILYKALVDSPLFNSLKKGSFEEIPINEGDILKLSSDGEIETEKFKYTVSYGRSWCDYGYYGGFTEDEDYLDLLKAAATFEGHNPEIVDYLIENGFTYDEVEEYIYS